MNASAPAKHRVTAGPIARCQVCAYSELKPILDLGHQPLCDSLLSPAQLTEPETTYPLVMLWCPKCTCVQINYCVDGATVFHPDYPYRTGISQPLVEYQTAMSQSLTKRYGLGPTDLVVDIGSNDGTLLRSFKKNGVRVLGVEPTHLAKFANAAQLPTVQEFFTERVGKRLRKTHGQASLIVATNVFAHVENLGDVIRGVYALLRPTGTFVVETHYLLDVLQKGQFDTMYHEHLRTYSLRSLIVLFASYDFTVVDVERGSRYGGNLRVHVARGRGRRAHPRVSALLAKERQAKLHTLAPYRAFARRAHRARQQFVDFLVQARQKGKTVVGKSCPGRAMTLLNYCRVGPELLPYLAEQPTSLKVGLFTPGTHIPVVDEKILFKEQPDYAVILAWHYATEIMHRLKSAGLRSDFVIPLPRLRVIKNRDVRL